jgi:TetR/AcrR family transcriptional repressor of bet genes
VATRVGLADLTVGEVAKAAGVSTALVHYHFDTKQALLVAAVERAVAADAEDLMRALADGEGLETLDLLWEALEERAGTGRAAFALEVRLRAARAADLAAALAGGAAVTEAIAKRLPALLRELGARLSEPREEVAAAVHAFLDGISLALAGGRPAAEVRAAYDAFWLTLIAAGQNARRR